MSFHLNDSPAENNTDESLISVLSCSFQVAGSERVKDEGEKRQK